MFETKMCDLRNLGKVSQVTRLAPNRRARRLLAFAVVAAIPVIADSPRYALGSVSTWVGNTSANLGDLNWTGSPDNPPVSGDAWDFGAAGSSGTALSDNLTTGAAWTVTGISFNSGASAFTITPGSGSNTFTLMGGITNSASSTTTETINDPFAITDSESVTGGGATVLAGNISGAGGSLTMAGTGTLTLSGTNSYNSGTTISAGTVIFANAAAVPSTGAITIASGAIAQLNYGSGAGTFASLVGNTSAGVIALNASSSDGINLSNAGTVSLGSPGISGIIYSGTLTPNGQTYRLGGGTTSHYASTWTVSSTLTDVNSLPTNVIVNPEPGLNLNGPNSYSGTTTVNGNGNLFANVYLAANTLANGGSPSSIGESSNAAANLILNAAELEYTGTVSTSTDRLFTINGTCNILNSASGGHSLTFSNTGAIAFLNANTASTLDLNVGTGGPLILDSQITDNSGATRMTTINSTRNNNGGQIELLSTTSTFTGPVTLGSNGTTLTVAKLTNGGVTNISISTSSGSAAATLSSTAGLISGDTYGVSTADVTGGTTFLYSGSANITLSGNALGTATNASSTIGLPSSVGISTNAASNFAFPGSGNNGAKTLIYVGSGDTTDRNMSISTNSQYGAADNFIISASGTGALIMTGSPTISLGNPSDFDQYAPGLTLSGTAAANLVNQFNGTIGDFTNPLPLSITKTGAATWSLGNSSNTYSGATIINAGILQATKLAVGGSPSSIGESTNAATNLILNGGTLQYAGTGDTTDRNFTLLPGGGALDASGSGAVTFSNTAILSPDPANQAVTTTANATITGITTTVGLYVGMPVGDGDNLIPNGTTISSIASATSIVLSHAAAAGSTTLDFGYGARTLTLTGTSTSSNSIAGILQDSQTVNTTVGTLSITKTGAGTWELGGANTYTGPTAVNGGTLLVDGSIASPTTVGNTGTLGGHGTISNSVTISAGGTLSPGDSPGQLTVNSLALTSSGTGSTTLMQIGGTTLGSQYDNVDVTTSAGLAYGGALQIVSYSPWNVSAQSDIYDLFTFTGGATGDFSGVTVDGFSLTDSSGIWSGTNGGATYTFADSTGILDVSGAVPEPASLCLLGLGGGMMLLRRRRAAKMI